MKYSFAFGVFIVPLLNISLWAYIIIKYNFKSQTFNRPVKKIMPPLKISHKLENTWMRIGWPSLIVPVKRWFVDLSSTSLIKLEQNQLSALNDKTFGLRPAHPPPLPLPHTCPLLHLYVCLINSAFKMHRSHHSQRQKKKIDLFILALIHLRC